MVGATSWVGDGGQFNQDHTIIERVAHLGGDLQSQPRFANARRANECEQARVLAHQSLADGDHIPFAPDEGRRQRGQVARWVKPCAGRRALSGPGKLDKGGKFVRCDVQCFRQRLCYLRGRPPLIRLDFLQRHDGARGPARERVLCQAKRPAALFEPLAE